MECSVCGGKVEEIHKASGICDSCANLLGEMGPSGLEALNRQQKRYNALKDGVAEKDRLIEKLKAVNHRQAEDISGLDLAYKSADVDRELLRGEIAGLKQVDIPAFQNQLAITKTDRDRAAEGTEYLRVQVEAKDRIIAGMKADAQEAYQISIEEEREKQKLLLQIDAMRKLLCRVYACHQPDVCDCDEPSDGPHSDSCISTRVANVALQKPMTEKPKEGS